MKVAFLLSFLLITSACTDDDGNEPLADAQVIADADPNAPDADPNTTLPFMSECDVADDRCNVPEGELCFGFRNKGPHCTHDCTDASMCESPSSGCGNQGVCKPP